MFKHDLYLENIMTNENKKADSNRIWTELHHSHETVNYQSQWNALFTDRGKEKQQDS